MMVYGKTDLVRIFCCLKFIVCYLTLEDLPSQYLNIEHGNFSRRYILETELGKGAYGTVFLASSESTSKNFAIKVQRIDFYNIFKYSPDIQFTTILRHENIVEIFEFKIIQDLEYAIYEYIPLTFCDFFRTHIVEFETFIYFIKQILDALNYLRIKKIVYLDLKDNNIMITEDFTCKIIDFGIATFEESQNNIFKCADTSIGDVNDTKYSFYAPEIRACKKFNHKADIWSLGQIFEEYFEGYKETIKSKEYKLIVADFISKTLDPSPKNRISADKALLHPIFNILYDFVFCFAILPDFFHYKNDFSLIKNGKRVFFKNKRQCFEIHCCCINKTDCFQSGYNLTHKFKFSNRIFQIFSKKKIPNADPLKFKVLLNEQILPIQHLTHRQYKKLKLIFKILRNKLQN
ncbi:protein kinase [Hamiltosporidium tvaerminnensis]|uniref:non-specific serine/threonine protein kinase n=1 Tax=Hamiltosporidium tvaerminnensis TaxID=1176355 RepID=A0A4Q9KYN7_9MICR|nr:protein kinase [Hamiltosporidium tvaerminnensis]